MAVQGFKGLGWFLCGVVVAPACYLVNSNGAAEQAKLNATKAAIVQAQRDIRALETEFNTRANMAQLERWNGEVLALAAPSPQQYLANELALASLGAPGADAEIQMASLVVPAGVPVAAPVAPAPAVQTAAVEAAPAKPAVQTASRDPGAAVAARQDKELRKLMKRADKRAVAMVGDGVLSASTMSDLQKLAKREQLALR
ncbi:hypothetical protein [Sphingomonas sp. M1-B02]|uniref:hypothetical protein n=1 Tax=Sphingomonas sp. M1-B02 TaxID=3114300 RepID=UPI00223EBD8A|nr:hypothetical protein [Sphingomonas sp. S6-11]UZK67394.1 hypothetical protein OKW87_06060 [Sphingomonas sp. S6-11]